MKNKILLLLILIFTINFVNGAEYSSHYNINYNDEMSVGNNKLFDLVISPISINEEIIIISKINDTYISVNGTVYDKFKLSETNSQAIKIGNTIISPGEDIVFENPSDIIFSEVLNENITGSITVNDIMNPDINLSFLDLNFNYTLMENNSLINNYFELDREKTIEMNITIPDNAPATTHSIVLKIKTNNNTVNELIEFIIDELKLLEITKYNFVKEINSGTSGSGGNITLINPGNSYTNINISIIGNISNILSLPSTATIYPNTKTKLTAFYNLGDDIITGNYSGQIKFVGINSDVNEIINISTTIIDIIKPIIEEEDIPEFTIGFNQELRLKITDNTGIKNVFITPFDNNETKETREGFIRDAETNWWVVDLSLLNIGDYRFEIEIIDLDDNVAYYNRTSKSRLQDVIETNDFYRFLTTKYNKWVELDFFIVNKSIPITLNPKRINYKGNYTLVLELPNRKDRFFYSMGDDEPESITINEVGKYKLKFKGSSIGDYNGIIEVETNDFHKKIKDITFVGEIKDFYVPEDYKDDWYTGNIDCSVNDGGNPENSETVCVVTYKGYVDIKTSGIPVTKELKDSFENDFNKEIDSYKEKNFKKLLLIIFLLMGLFDIILLLVYIAYIRPVFRIKIR